MKDHIEIERKYIIKRPDIEMLRNAEAYTCSDIVQIYLCSAPRVTHRIRSRTSCATTVFTETKKVRIDKISAYEDEREITENEFLELKRNMDPDTQPIIKTRHTFIYKGQLFEVDVYPQWQSCAIMETEIDSPEKTVDMPPFIEIIKEVSGIKGYSNAAMARSFPEEA